MARPYGVAAREPTIATDRGGGGGSAPHVNSVAGASSRSRRPAGYSEWSAPIARISVAKRLDTRPFGPGARGLWSRTGEHFPLQSLFGGANHGAVIAQRVVLDRHELVVSHQPIDPLHQV